MTGSEWNFGPACVGLISWSLLLMFLANLTAHLYVANSPGLHMLELTEATLRDVK